MDEIKVTFDRDIDASELLTPVSRDSLDIQEIMRIHNVELNLLWDVMLDIFSNQFIKYATEYGLSQWEGMLDISSDGSFETRRNRILRELMGLRPYTLESFQKMLDAMYGKGAVIAELDNDKYALWFNLSVNVIYKRNDIYTLSDQLVPKNLLLFFKNEKECEAEMIGIGGYVTIGSIVSVQADKGVNIEELSANPSICGYVNIQSSLTI